MDHFHLRHGELYAEDVPLALIAREVGTPVYVYSRATLARQSPSPSPRAASMSRASVWR